MAILTASLWPTTSLPDPTLTHGPCDRHESWRLPYLYIISRRERVGEDEWERTRDGLSLTLGALSSFSLPPKLNPHAYRTIHLQKS